MAVLIPRVTRALTTSREWKANMPIGPATNANAMPAMMGRTFNGMLRGLASGESANPVLLGESGQTFFGCDEYIARVRAHDAEGVPVALFNDNDVTARSKLYGNFLQRFIRCDLDGERFDVRTRKILYQLSRFRFVRVFAAELCRQICSSNGENQ